MGPMTHATFAEEQGFMCLAGGPGSSSCGYAVTVGGATISSCSKTCEGRYSYACCGLKCFTETACECRYQAPT